MICDVDIMYFYSIINHTLFDPQWRASRADMWVRPVDRTSPQRRNRQSAAQSNDNTSQHHEHRQHTNNAHKRPRARLPGPWAARSLAAGRQAACRAATLLPVTPWPLRAALGPRQEATHYSISKKRLVAASRKPRRAGREAPCHARTRSMRSQGTYPAHEIGAERAREKASVRQRG